MALFILFIHALFLFIDSFILCIESFAMTFKSCDIVPKFDFSNNHMNCFVSSLVYGFG